MVQHRFVEFMPAVLEPGILYISIEYCTAIHLCVCGCSNKVVTPISPTSWQLSFDGKTVSLYPSIGNWNFECQSHYWINNNKIEHASKWSRKQISDGRSRDERAKDEYYKDVPTANQNKIVAPEKASIFKRIAKYLGF